MEKNVRFNSLITNVEKINPLFSRATIRVLYKHFNRNGSYLTDESVDKALPTIYNIPIVGEYIEHADNFGGHGTGIEITDQGIKLIQSTIPYGVVPESAKLYWEDVTEKDGTVNSYLVVDGAYLWTGRYEQLNSLLENSYGQSMEIEVTNGNFAVIDGIETFKIDEFIFSALCILGIDKDGEGHVEPAFESANITTYSLNKDDFKKQFNQMIAELKFSLEQGGNEMTNKINADTTPEVERTVLDMFTEAQFTEAHEINASFGIVEPEINPEPIQEFALTAQQLQQQLRIAIGKEKHTDQWGDICRRYWYVDHTDASVIVEDYQDGYQLYSVDYTLAGDTVTIKTDTAVKVKVEYVPFEGDSVAFSANIERLNLESDPVVDSKLQEDFTALTTENETLQSQLSELQTYKRHREENDLKAKFEGKLSDEDFNQVFTELKEESLEKVEEKLFALIGKKNFSIQPTQKTNVNKVTIVSPKEEIKPFGGFFD